MGFRGPAPKREAERRRRNKTDSEGNPNEVTTIEVDEDALAAPVEAPEPDPEWHDTAWNLYYSLGRSGTKIFMEPSDWAMAYMICEQISKHLQPQIVTGPEGAVLDEDGAPLMRVVPMSGSTLSALIKGLNSLGVSEESRRRMRIELERSNAAEETAKAPATVTDIRKSRLA